jgi:hypothetical protein
MIPFGLIRLMPCRISKRRPSLPVLVGEDDLARAVRSCGRRGRRRPRRRTRSSGEKGMQRMKGRRVAM